MTVTVKRVGKSLAVIIPISVARRASLVEGTRLQLIAGADYMTMRRQGHRPRRSIGRIAKQMNRASYARRSEELLKDRAVGREIW